MNTIMGKLEKKIMPVMSKVSNQKHLNAIRDGLISTIPITVVGSIFILLANLPWPQSYVFFLSNHPDLIQKLMIPYGMSVGLLSVYASFGIGLRLAKTYNIDGLSGGGAALFTFLVSLTPTVSEAGLPAIQTQYLGGEGMFIAIITSIFAVEVLRLCKKYNITLKLPDQVPSNVSSSFEGLFPIVISMGITWTIVHIIGFDINSLIGTLITPLLSGSADSLIGLLAFVLLTVLMWLFGIHPAILTTIMTPVWMVNSDANSAAAQAGQAIPHLGVMPFIFTFIWIGGGGGTLALNTMMCFSKSEFLKKLGRLSIIPGIFNINEPLLFGLPIVLNPALAIPFVIAPVVNTIFTYLAFTTNLVPGMAYPLAAVWTIPSVFSSVIATTSIKAAILIIVNFLVSFAIYYPFYKIYDKKLVASENEKNL